MSILPPNIAAISAIVQSNLLMREFAEALFPATLFRSEAFPEKWDAQSGETKVMTRSSLLAPIEDPLTPGQDPTPQMGRYEQWVVSADQYSGALDTVMPVSRTALDKTVLDDASKLGKQAGQSLNRVARNRLFTAYSSGDTVVVTGATSTSVPVASINGFTHVIVNGVLTPVSVNNTKSITIGSLTRAISAAVPNDANFPLGPGTLTLTASTTFSTNDRVKAYDAPKILRPGGAATVDALTTGDVLTFALIRRAVAELADNGVPTHSDGTYHVHCTPKEVSNLTSDNEFQRANQGQGLSSSPYRDLAFGRTNRCTFIENNECPGPSNSGTLVSAVRGSSVMSKSISAEVRNFSGVQVVRTIVTGGLSLYEHWIDETREYLSEAGVSGKIGSFNIVANGIEVDTSRIRYILRSPQDRLQQVISQAWSWSGGFAVPTDLNDGKSNGRFKRAVVIETGGED